MRMRYALGAAFMTVAVAAIVAGNLFAATPEAIGCSGPHDPTDAARPIGSGPLTLAKFCPKHSAMVEAG